MMQVVANTWAVIILGPPLLLLGLLTYWAAGRRRALLGKLGDLPMVLSLLTSCGWRQTLRRIGLAIGLFLLVIAIAGPQWGRNAELQLRAGHDVVAVLDLSWSMFAETPNRVQRAKEALLDLANSMRQRGGHRLGLVVFAAKARVICPLTQDYDFFQDVLNQLDLERPPPELAADQDAVSGTRIGTALLMAVQTHEPDPQLEGYQNILLLSDGDDPCSDQEWKKGISEAIKRNLPIHVVGIGDPANGHPIPVGPADPRGSTFPSYLYHDDQLVHTRLAEAPLLEIANLTSGAYVPAHTRALPLGEVFHHHLKARAAPGGDTVQLPKQKYRWFLGGAILALAVAIAAGCGPWAGGSTSWRGGGGSPTVGSNNSETDKRLLLSILQVFLAAGSLALLSAAGPTPAVDLVRQGNSAFANGDFQGAVNHYSQAEERITDPGLVAFNKATAFYHLHRYAEAERYFRLCLQDATGQRMARALYGRGTSLVRASFSAWSETSVERSKTLAEAIRCFEECLAVDGAEARLVQDAEHNLQVAMLLLEQAKEAQNDGQTSDAHGRKPDTRPGGDNETTRPDPTKDKQPRPAASGTEPVPTDLFQPGKGNLPPVLDKDELVTMSPGEAAKHLRTAADRINRERQQRRSLHTPRPGVKDW